MEKFIGSTSGISSKAIFSPLDIYDREIYKKTFKKVPRASALSWMRAIKGRWSKRTTRNHTYYHYEKGQWYNGSATVGAIETTGSYFTITLSAESHEDVNGTDDGSFPIKNDIVLAQDGSTQAFIRSVDKSTPGEHKIVVQKARPSMDIATAFAEGNTMVFITDAQPERSTQVEGRIPRFEKVTNHLQTIRKGFQVTDHAMQNAVEIPIPGPNGGNYLHYEGIHDTADLFDMSREMACLLGPDFDSVTDTTGNSIESMHGLIPQTRQSGVTFEYFNRPDFAQFQNVNLGLKAAYGEKDYILGVGQRLRQGMSAWLVQFAQAGTGQIDFSAFPGGKTQALSIGLESVLIDGYSYHIQEWDLFSHPDSLGAPGMPFNDLGVFIPTGKYKAENPEGRSNTLQNTYEPLIQLVYSKPPFAPQHLHGDHAVWETGAAAASGATNDVAERYVHMIGYYSLEMALMHKFGLWEKA